MQISDVKIKLKLFDVVLSLLNSNNLVMQLPDRNDDQLHLSKNQ